jgi:DNA repair photolyase
MNDGEIDKYIAELIHKDDRTVRRYLKLASIKNKDIVKAVRDGSINYLDALVIGNKDFKEGDISALLGHLKVHPKSTRAFKQFYDNLEHCCDISGLSMTEVLLCKNSDEFLSLEKEELETRIKHLHNETGKDYQDILKGRAGSLDKAISSMDAERDRKSFQDRFKKASDPISKKITQAFKNSEIIADFTIKPGSGLQSEMIAVTISASVDQIQKAIDVVSNEAGERFASLKLPLESRFVTKTNTKGWKTIKIKTTSGDEVDALAPLIISASRRNDTPARHSEWFIEGLKRGYLEVSKKPKYVSFEKARLIVFWTKNPEPLLKHLHEINKKKIGYYFQYTLNDYDKEGFEPHIPPLAERIETFKGLSKLVGREKVIWRFDPLILAGDATPQQLVEKVERIMEQLAGHTEKLVISFYRTGDYKPALQRMQNKNIVPRDFKPEEITYVAKRLGELGRRHGMKVATCADSGDLSLYGIEHNKCIDDELIKHVFKDDKILIPFLESGKNLKDRGQRKECQCIVSEDIGSYNICANGCLYCYANNSDKALERNLGLIKESEKVNQKENPEVLPSQDVLSASNTLPVA